MAQNLRGEGVIEPELLENEAGNMLERVSRRLQNKFNRFRSYQNERVKPPGYSSSNSRHAVSEYLSPVQKYMVSNQRRDVPSNMYDSNWSGFNKGR